MAEPANRCRLVLIVPEIADADEQAKIVADALKGGDVASVIVPQYGLNDGEFQKHAEKLVPLIQNAGAAALIAGDSRVVGRSRADGLHLTGPATEIAEAIDKYADKLIVGGGNAADRHHALEIGEERPDYIFFGKLEGDIKPEAHPKNLALAEWWASMIEIPCIVMGGTDPASALAVAETGAEFVALRLAVFAEPARAPAIVAEINALLDEKAPRFED
ncbi:thiamine phosphate synthase [Rhizobium sp. AC44/96]|jgi:thiamine-phosphate pyrophosphorylase|uniref:thiamine phosphate synthase n=1 Tax=unclassified Rhizobium TaxID=2613769 RepID=UPI00080FAC18|nr:MULTISPECIES: thiamine phosphate synthase [unclassified Rhizobium]MDM9620225.1 thiamine phosphate synthase [Rhizobium sp. S96]OCJ13961.1 thiamine phosphate synthase [Rhizobium sp. AC44/96]